MFIDIQTLSSCIEAVTGLTGGKCADYTAAVMTLNGGMHLKMISELSTRVKESTSSTL